MPSDASAGASRGSGAMLAAGFVIAGIAFGVQHSFTTFFLPLQDTFGWSRGTTSWIMFFHLIGYGLLSFLAGFATDRWGLRFVLSTGAFSLGLGLVLSSLATSAWHFYFSYGVPLAWGVAACWNPVITSIARLFPTKRGTALGMVATGVGVGTLVLVPLAEHLIRAWGWRTAARVMGILCAGMVLLALFVVGYRRSPLSRDFPALGTAADGGEQFGEPRIWSRNLLFIAAAQTAFSLTVRMVMAHIVPYTSDLGVGSQTGAWVAGIIGGFSVLGRLVMGKVQDQIGAQKALLICLSIQSFSLLWLMFARREWMLGAFAVVFGFAYGGDVPQMPALVAGCFGLRRMGAIYGFITSCAGFAGALGPVLAGYLFDTCGSYRLSFGLAAMGLLGGTFCTTRIKMPFRR